MSVGIDANNLGGPVWQAAYVCVKFLPEVLFVFVAVVLSWAVC